MPVVSGVIMAPVDIVRDVAAVLGSSSKDLGTLCTHPDINMWSAKKPVEHNAPWITTDQKFEELHYGINMNIKTVAQIVSGYSGFCWEYTQPSTWFRLLDFDGYNHSATPPDFYFHAYPIYDNVAGDNGKLAMAFYGDGSDIEIMDIETKVANYASAASQPLSAWNVVFLIFCGNTTPHLFNTGETPSYFSIQRVVDYSASIDGRSLGDTIVIVPALAYQNNEMAVGDNLISGSFMNQYYLIPLSFTPQMESVMSVTIAHMTYLRMSVGYQQFLDPSTGSNTYKLAGSPGIVSTVNNTGTSTILFRLKLGLRRGNDTYYSITVIEQTLTTSSTGAPYVWYLTLAPNGYVNFSPSFLKSGSTSDYTTAQTGDVLFLEVSAPNYGETNTQNVKTVS